MASFALGGKASKKKRGVDALFGSEDDEEAAQRERLEVQRKRALEMGMRQGSAAAVQPAPSKSGSGGPVAAKQEAKPGKKAADYSSLMAEQL